MNVARYGGIWLLVVSYAERCRKQEPRKAVLQCLLLASDDAASDVYGKLRHTLSASGDIIGNYHLVNILQNQYSQRNYRLARSCNNSVRLSVPSTCTVLKQRLALQKLVNLRLKESTPFP